MDCVRKYLNKCWQSVGDTNSVIFGAHSECHSEKGNEFQICAMQEQYKINGGYIHMYGI